MKRSWHKILFALATAGFILAAVNITLALHLAGQDENEHHDYENCPICQQAMINKNPAILYPDVNVYQGEEEEYTISYRNICPPQIIEYQLPQLRAPPFFC